MEAMIGKIFGDLGTLPFGLNFTICLYADRSDPT